MTALQVVIMVVVGTGAAGVVLTRDPLRQAIMVSFYGLTLAVLFLIWQAPDVSLSEIVIGAVALPLMILLAIAKTRGRQE